MYTLDVIFNQHTGQVARKTMRHLRDTHMHTAERSLFTNIVKRKFKKNSLNLTIYIQGLSMTLISIFI